MPRTLTREQLIEEVRRLNPTLAPSHSGAQDERFWFDGQRQPSCTLRALIERNRAFLLRELGPELRATGLPRRQLGDTAGAWVMER